ncbi:MAG TPA: hypothetical protein VKD90_02670, partial [Gemmataceae bacterium]|nr:hypothetical protein [Gemmataceae bacterium]
LSPTAADNGTINGWNVSFAGQTITATRSNALAAGNSYPALTLTVAVAASAPASVTNTATVSGGGQVNTTNDSDSDPTTIQPVADLTITKTHSGDFTQGDTNRTYTITVSNPGPGPTRGAVTVTDALPTGLTPTAANSGTINGWTVSRNGQTVTATRNDTLASGLSYPALSLIADVDFDAPASVVNTAAVSGGGELNTANDIASDPTTIQPNVTPNQPPVNTLPATFATAEDIALTLSGLSVVDPDAGGGNVKVTLAVTSGTLLLSTTVGGGVAAGQVTGNGTGTLVVTASLSAINATLANANGLRFTPAENASGPVTLTMTTDDLGHNGTGGPLTDTDTASMAVSALNDAPVNTLPPTSSTPADTPLSLSGISIADVDAGANPVSVVLNVTTGKLTVNTSVTGAVTAANVTGNGSGLVTLFAPLAAVNTTLAAATGLIFTPPPAFAGTAILTVVTNDLGNSGPGGALSDSDTETITVTRVLDHFSINVPAGSIAGVPFDATITARDATGNVIANYGGSVELVTSDAQGSLPPSATFTAGVATFSVTLKTAGAQTVTATDTAVPAVTVQGTVAVSPAVGARLTFEQQPTGTLAGAPFRPAIRVSARDAFGNLVTTDTSDAVTVRLQNNPTGATLGGTTSARLVDGVATFPMLQINKPGSGFTLVAAAAGLPAAVSSPFSVAAVTRFVVTASQPTTTAGTGLTVTVRALDARGQVVANYAGQVHFTSTDPQALLPADGTLTNGEGSFPVTLRTAGPRTIIIADLGKPTVRGSLARSVTVTPAAVSALRATGLTAPTPAGQRQTLTVAAVDAFGNINPGYRGTVTLTSTDSAALLPPAYTFTARDAGKHAFGVTLRTVGLRTITISDGTLTAERPNILVAGPAAAVLSQPDPGDPAKTALVAIGTAGNDLIEVAPTNLSGTQIEVRVNGLSQGSAFAPTGHLLLYGLGGNDSIQLRTGTGTLAGVQLAMPVVIDAGAGNDAVDAAGSAGPAVVLGRDGSDVLSGGAGRDLLVGGRGLDNLRGAAGDDILIAGPTTLEPDLTGLLAVMAEWSDAGTDFVTRVRHLSGVTPGGANGPYLLKAATVQSDPSIDQLAGGADRDWFLFTAAGRTADRLLDVADGEMVTGL